MAVDYASRLMFKIWPIDKSKTKCLSYGLLLANSMISQTAKGMFAFLPLGQRVLDKLTRLIENELNDVGAQKCSLPLIGFDKVWSKSGRWNIYGSSLFRLKDRLDNEGCLQPTCEEMVSEITSRFGIFKTASLPIMLYQSTDKFRDEMNPRFGLLRSRQFLMNDLYSFDENGENACQTYERISEVYRRIFFEKLNLQDTLIVSAGMGEIGGHLSHEYHLPNESAEDRILRCKQCNSTFQAEMVTHETCPDCNIALDSIISVEVGHTFLLGEHYSSLFDLVSSNGSPYFMCCFGIGISRLIAASIDTLTTSTNAMRLPNAICPYKLAIVLPKVDDNHYMMSFSNDLIRQVASMPNLKDDILIDDRVSKSIGRRLVELNQVGIPNIVVMPAKKSAKSCDIIKMEFFRTRPKEESLDMLGLFTHDALFNMLRDL